MGLFSFFRSPDITEGVRAFRNTVGAFLIDVRTPSEYRNGHIEGSVNFPLDRIMDVADAIGDKDTPIFVYCHSGARSAQATALLNRMGYKNVRNIGGIVNYKEKVVN